MRSISAAASPARTNQKKFRAPHTCHLPTNGSQSFFKLAIALTHAPRPLACVPLLAQVITSREEVTDVANNHPNANTRHSTHRQRETTACLIRFRQGPHLQGCNPATCKLLVLSIVSLPTRCLRVRMCPNSLPQMTVCAAVVVFESALQHLLDQWGRLVVST
jgi:hypothetical protein